METEEETILWTKEVKLPLRKAGDHGQQQYNTSGAGRFSVPGFFTFDRVDDEPWQDCQTEVLSLDIQSLDKSQDNIYFYFQNTRFSHHHLPQPRVNAHVNSLIEIMKTFYIYKARLSHTVFTVSSPSMTNMMLFLLWYIFHEWF